MAEKVKQPILIVDDEPEILHSLRALLRRDFEVHTAGSAAEALQVLGRQPVHVIMSDQRMPGTTGVELLSRVRQEHPEAVRLIFTGYADIKAVIDAINQGSIYRYLTKPWDPDELRSALQQACAAYEQIHESRGLLADLRAYLDRCLPQLQARPETAALAEAGGELQARLGRALGVQERKEDHG
jgi:DNA-binding NtrC family response regulator